MTDIEGRLLVAMTEANHLRANYYRQITIHIGPEVAEWARQMLEGIRGRDSGDSTPDTFFGYPVIIEPDWDPRRIDVRLTLPIY